MSYEFSSGIAEVRVIEKTCIDLFDGYFVSGDKKLYIADA